MMAEQKAPEVAVALSDSPRGHNTEDLMTDQLTKRTRRGEKFTPANEVNLHGNDFEWADLLKELTPEESALYSQFRSKCSARILSVRRSLLLGKEQGTSCADCYYPLSHGTMNATCSSSVDGAAALPVLTASCGATVTAPPHQHVHDPQNWERHYATNKQHFPIKNYIVHAFPSLVPRTYPGQSHAEALDELCRSSSSTTSAADDSSVQQQQQQQRVIMEAGCGTGSVTHPLMKLFKDDAFICHDVSATAVEVLREHEVSSAHVSAGRYLKAFVLDLSKNGHAVEAAITENCQGSSGIAVKGNMDFILLVFVLSAMPSLQHMVHVLRQLRSYLKPGTGRLLFRDYGALDHNFFRFHRQENMFLESSLNFLKGDGTEQFFYDIETVHELFALAGLAPASETVYHCNRIVNRKNGKRMDKVFVNGEFGVAPLPEDDLVK